MKGLPQWSLRQQVLALFCGIAFMPMFLQASPQLTRDHPDSYTVVMDDTLWDISARFLKQPWLWPEIWHANPQISNPHLIYPGDEIRLIYINGEPRLMVGQRNVAFRPTGKVLPNGTVKLSPRIRSSKLEDTIPTIPLDIVHAFLSRNRIVSAKQIKRAPYVVVGQEQRILLGEGDKLYARGNIDRNIGSYGIYRFGKAIKHPITGKRLGYEGVGIGNVTASAFGDQVSTFRVTDSFEEIRLGDRLITQPTSAIHSMFYPTPPANNRLFGKVVGINDDLKRAGRFEVVTLSLGEREGVNVGNVFAIYTDIVRVEDPVKGGKVTLPEEPVGHLMVFNTFEKLSYALVMEASRPVEIGASLYHPNADMSDRKAVLARIEAAKKANQQRQCRPRRYRNGKRLERCDFDAASNDTWLVDVFLNNEKTDALELSEGVNQNPPHEGAENVHLRPVSTKPKATSEQPSLEK